MSFDLEAFGEFVYNENEDPPFTELHSTVNLLSQSKWPWFIEVKICEIFFFFEEIVANPKITKIFSYSLFYFGDAGDWTQGFTYSKHTQIMYYFFCLGN